MEHTRHLEIVRKLNRIPRKLVEVHGLDNVTEFVMHELCNEECFGLMKAAFFVDNPDFDTFKGVSGFAHDEIFLLAQDIWSAQDDFTEHMRQSKFNQRVRGMERSSCRRGCVCDVEVVETLAKELNLKNPEYLCWEMKHENHGMLLFEHDNENMHILKEDLEHACHLLSMCPVF